MIKKIKPISKKRSVLLKAYKALCDEMDLNKPYYCWFCGKEIKEVPDHHHSLGRDGDYLLAKNHLVHAHRSCHFSYHFDSLSLLLKTEWYIRWIGNLSDVEIRRKELDKFFKNNLNPLDYGIRIDI